MAIQRDTTKWGIDAEEFRPERHLDSEFGFSRTRFQIHPIWIGKKNMSWNRIHIGIDWSDIGQHCETIQLENGC